MFDFVFIFLAVVAFFVCYTMLITIEGSMGHRFMGSIRNEIDGFVQRIYNKLYIRYTIFIADLNVELDKIYKATLYPTFSKLSIFKSDIEKAREGKIDIKKGIVSKHLSNIKKVDNK